MKTTPYLPGLHLPISRRKARSSQQILADEIEQLKLKSFSQLGECFSRFIPKEYLHPTESGALSRRSEVRKHILGFFLSGFGC
ncbi:MAG: hypothetical protein R8M38_09720 [Mariprofundaceae bacterium]